MMFVDFLPPYLPCQTIFNLQGRILGVILDPLPTLKLDVINGRSPIVKSIIRKVDGGGASGLAQWLWWVGDI